MGKRRRIQGTEQVRMSCRFYLAPDGWTLYKWTGVGLPPIRLELGTRWAP